MVKELHVRNSFGNAKGKNRHIHLRHEVVKWLLKDEIVSIDYIKSEVNLVDPLTKPLRRKLILETSSRMRIKPIRD